MGSWHLGDREVVSRVCRQANVLDRASRAPGAVSLAARRGHAAKIERRAG
jgi:hypothetical protein